MLVLFTNPDIEGLSIIQLTFGPDITEIDVPLNVYDTAEIEPFSVSLELITTGLNLVIEPGNATISIYGFDG